MNATVGEFSLKRSSSGYIDIIKRGGKDLFTLMTKESALEISQWTYSGIYSCYSFDGDSEILAELMNGEYYVAWDKDNKILGYICIGKSAQIPTLEKGIYKGEMVLDIGLGLTPALCGNGYGSKFLADGIAFAKQKFNTSSYRLTVASFNQRAIKAYERVGFKYSMSVHHAVSNEIFYICR